MGGGLKGSLIGLFVWSGGLNVCLTGWFDWVGGLDVCLIGWSVWDPDRPAKFVDSCFDDSRLTDWFG